MLAFTQIDYFLNTHFHGDHFGSIPDLVMRIPIRNFVDSGTISEASERAVASFQTYAKVRATGHHIVAKPGDTVPITGIDVQVVTSGGAAITRPLAGAGAPNPLCGDITLQEVDTSEDARSVGIVIRLGSFRMIDLGDLTWNKENELACPNNLVGTVDLYLATRHGLNGAGLPALVQGLKPRVSVINNGGTKGASPEHFLTIKNSPGLEDIWQLHYSMPRAGIPRLHETSRPGGPDLNTSEPLIANLDDTTAHYLKLTARADGSFVLLNPRNGHTKEYLRRP